MSEKKISRRDAIKLLGAAVGATALANLPSKWNKPELTSGVLPAHAQTSVCANPLIGAVPVSILNGQNGFVSFGGLADGEILNYSVTIIGPGTWGGSSGPFIGSLVISGGTASADFGIGAGFAVGTEIRYIYTGAITACEFITLVADNN